MKVRNVCTHPSLLVSHCDTINLMKKMREDEKRQDLKEVHPIVMYCVKYNVAIWVHDIYEISIVKLSWRY